MLFSYKVEAPANTTYDNRVVQNLKVYRGIITRVLVLIPAGHHALAHLVLSIGETPIAPEHGVEGIRGDDQILPFLLYHEVTSDEEYIKAECWNEDDTYSHAFYVYVEIQPPELAQATQELVKIMQQIRTLLIARRIS